MVDWRWAAGMISERRWLTCSGNCTWMDDCWRDRYFFFQAEDGIRDYKVTGVQTCALPIFQRFLQAPVDDRMLLRQVGAEGHQAVRVLEVAVAAGRAVGAERTLVARHGRGHADRKSVV